MIFNFSKEYKFAIMPLLFFAKNVCILASAILLPLFLFIWGINGLPGGFECTLYSSMLHANFDKIGEFLHCTTKSSEESTLSLKSIRILIRCR